MSENSPVERQQARLDSIEQDLQSIREVREEAHENGLTREDVIAELREHLGAAARAAGKLATLAASEHAAVFQGVKEKISTILATAAEAGIAEESRNPDVKSAVSYTSECSDEAALALVLLNAMSAGAAGLQASIDPLSVVEPLWVINSTIGTANVNMTHAAQVASEEIRSYRNNL